MTRKYTLTILFIYSILKSTVVFSYSTIPIIFNNIDKPLRIGDKVLIFEDKTNTLSLNDILKSKLFKYSGKEVPNLGVTQSSFWIKFSIKNQSSSPNLLLEIAQPTLTDIAFYAPQKDGRFNEQNEGLYKSFYSRFYKNQNYLFDINIPIGKTETYFLKLNSRDQVMLPIYLGNTKTIFESLINKDLIFGIFIGILIVMALYNIFVYFTVKDKVYIYYVIYILLIILLQGSLQGYAFRFIWPTNLWLAKTSIFIFPAVADIGVILFTIIFLNTKALVPTLHKFLYVLITFLSISILLTLLNQYKLSFVIMQLITLIASFYLLFISIVILKKGYRPAKFFLISWSFLLAGAIIFVLKDFAILPYNGFTSSSLQLGSALEVVLLSFALADKINDYKKEKEISQAQALAALEENARIIKEQNVTLERKVDERTTELVAANEDIKRTLTELKEAEAQLVEAEKMASLGQLTAGIAHEINNPINFVTSNVAPLRRDVDMLVDAITNIESFGLSDNSLAEKQQQIEDYKEEIDLDYLKIEINHLLNGINEGATRTADIVKGLKIFSRLDEDDIKKADINDGLESTLIIANNMIGNKIKVVKNLSKTLPLVDCYPGKLNQVFLNIISNAVFAINDKFKDQPGGILNITTEYNEEYLLVKIEDNGSGMSETTKKKIYEPFFTTKDVGVGTGLGMSIVYNTIKKHNAQIYLNSEEGVGTEFVIELQLIMKEFITDFNSEQNG